jgi:hypothetical protein
MEDPPESIPLRTRSRPVHPLHTFESPLRGHVQPRIESNTDKRQVQPDVMPLDSVPGHQILETRGRWRRPRGTRVQRSPEPRLPHPVAKVDGRPCIHYLERPAWASCQSMFAGRMLAMSPLGARAEAATILLTAHIFLPSAKQKGHQLAGGGVPRQPQCRSLCRPSQPTGESCNEATSTLL